MHFEENKEYRVKQVIVPIGVLPDLIFMVPGTGFLCVDSDLPEDAELVASLFDQQAGAMRYFFMSQTFDAIPYHEIHLIPILKGAILKPANAKLPSKAKAEPDAPKIVTE